MTTTAFNSTLEQLNWRAAIKKYDPEKKLSQEQLDLLIESARMAPTSYGLQPIKLYVISNPEIKKQLLGPGYNQPQFTDASHIFVLAARETVTQKDITEYMDRIVEQRNVPRESLQGLEGMIQGSTQGGTDEGLFNWASKQAYIALGVMLTVAAEHSIDTTPIEGFIPQKFDEILDTRKDGYKTSVVLAAGFRAEDEAYATMPKVRKTREEFVEMMS